MGFNSVFRSLQEVFPQVDVRILKAVAIEHSKDADAAVEFILFEVLPSISSPPEVSHTPIVNQDVKHPSICSPLEAPHNPNDYLDAEQLLFGEEEQSFLLKPQEAVEEASEDSSDTNYTNSAPYTCLNEAIAGLSVLNLDAGTQELISSAKHKEVIITAGSHQGSHAASSSMIHEETVVTGHCRDVPHANIQDLNEPAAYDSDSSICGDGHQGQSCLDTTPSKAESASFLIDPSAVHEATPDYAECASENIIASSVSEYEKPGSRGSLENISEQVDFETEMVDVEDESFSTTIVTRSGQICRIDLLEDAIRDAKNNKKTLFSAMESAINMMREVEFQEKAAEQAKEAASRGGLDILAKVEDLRQMLRHAKEANDMHTGEVYGEKAILATEARELQSRLLNLSDERDRSLAILDEMCQTLEARLAAAEEERKAAEQEKLEKEESARKALAEQEFIMDKVVQESKRLQQEAEENSKLREFLMDRGHVVDILQGEIAVICQDVKLLKEKFEERVPISKSLSSSQTSCILASSSSSCKSLAIDRVPAQVESSEAPKKTSPATSINGGSQKSSSEEKGISDDRKALLDDEWELFDDEAELYS